MTKTLVWKQFYGKDTLQACIPAIRIYLFADISVSVKCILFNHIISILLCKPTFLSGFLVQVVIQVRSTLQGFVGKDVVTLI